MGGGEGEGGGGSGGGGEDAKVRIARLAAELGSIAPPDDLPGMILSGNAVRRSEYLEAANRKQSELIAAYEEHTARLEGLVAAALDVQSELTEIVRMQSGMIPDGPGRGKSRGGGARSAAAAAGSGAKSRGGGSARKVAGSGAKSRGGGSARKSAAAAAGSRPRARPRQGKAASKRRHGR